MEEETFVLLVKIIVTSIMLLPVWIILYLKHKN